MIYETPAWLLAFSVGKGVRGTEPGVDAREVGLQGDGIGIGADHIMIPRQTHSTNVRWVNTFGEVPDTDAVITAEKGLCIAVKPKCRITISKMTEVYGSCPTDIVAQIGPGISLDSFEVGDEVYEQFVQAGFPMQRLAKRYPSGEGEKWHINLKDANRWLLEQNGVQHILISDVDTLTSPHFYSARRDTINTGRNINGIMIRPLSEK